ncbi:MAG: methyltransferase domain-containing protein [Thermoanaerobaculia bacterium]
MTAPNDWWKSFFSGLAVEFWRGAIPAEATLSDADFFEKSLSLSPGARVLDAPCGAGRFSLELARRGYRMTGVDISPEFLAAARAQAAAEGQSVLWRESDMRDLPWPGEFDAAFCAGNSFGFFDDAGNAEFLAAVARAVKPGARFLLDWGWVAESILANFHAAWDIEAGGVRFEGKNAYDPMTGRVENQYTLTRGPLTEQRAASHRVYTVSQLLAMCRAAGFTSFECFGSTDGAPYGLGSPRLLLVARKAS